MSLPVKIVYPIPMEDYKTWQLFRPFVERFCHSLRNTNPGHAYTLELIVNDVPVFPEDSVSLFNEFAVNIWRYSGSGCDIGAFQYYAEQQDRNVFMVCCVTRVFAWKAGWLGRLVEARQMFGPGLYATSISKEGGKLHSCCRCYGMDSEDFKKYPHKITSRDQGVFFELGEGCLLDWYRKLRPENPPKVVYWDGVCDILDDPEAHCFSATNIFRKGDQSNLLVKDKHTLIYDEASSEEKKRLHDMCYDFPPPSPLSGIIQTP